MDPFAGINYSQALGTAFAVFAGLVLIGFAVLGESLRRLL